MTNHDAIVSDDDIQAALAEAESRTSDIPGLDEGPKPAVVHVPVDAVSTIPPRAQPAPASEPLVVSAPTEPAARPAPEDEAPAAPQRKRRSRVGRVAFNVLDRMLSAINQPFDGCTPETRRIIGVVAIITIGLSVLAATLLPWLQPPQDPASVLQRQNRAAQTIVSETTPAQRP